MRASAFAIVFLAFGIACTEHTGSSNAAVTVCGQTTIQGIDVYHGDNGGNAIDWNAVKSAGISFAFVKATEGTTFTDPMFATNWAGLQSAGLVRGAYHFLHSNLDPNAQATFFLSTVGALSPGDMLVLDLESADGESQATIISNATTFLEAVQSASGVTPILYVKWNFLSSFTAFGAYPLWITDAGAACPDVPAPWATYNFWQSTGTGSLAPITGNLDLDSFNGSLSDLLAFAGVPTTSDAGSDATAIPDATTTQDAAADSAVGEDAATTPPPAPPNDQSSGCNASPRTARDASPLVLLAMMAIARARRRVTSVRK